MCVHGGIEERFVNSRQQGKISVLDGVLAHIKHFHQSAKQISLFIRGMQKRRITSKYSDT